MKIIVCVKAVAVKLVYGEQQREERLTLNPYDLYALEQALAIKKTMNDCTITCLCMGTKDAKSVLIHCLAMGADDVILLSDQKFAGADTFATAFTLQKTFEMLEYDLIICGNKSVDGETGQVSYELANRLGIPCIAEVKTFETVNSDCIIVKVEEMDKSVRIRSKLPVLLSFSDFETDSGSISLLRLKKAQRKEIPVLTAEQLGLDAASCGQEGSKTRVLSSGSALEKKNVVMLTGTNQLNCDFIKNKLSIRSY